MAPGNLTFAFLRKFLKTFIIWQVAFYSLDTTPAIQKAKLLARSNKAAEETGLVNILTHHNDNRRTGANLNETILNTANVNSRQFGKLFSRTVEGFVYAQPLYVSQVDIPEKGHRNVVYVATEGNNVYAFDADEADESTPLWQVNLGVPVPSSDIAPNYRDLIPEIGITSTPVIDISSQTIYLVAKSKELSEIAYHQRLHALDLATGKEKPGSPIEITASVAGSGTGNVDGIISLDPLLNLNRPGLLLLNGVIYLAFGSHGGTEPYHGWVLGYDAKTLQQVAVFNTTPDGGEGSIWQSGQGLVADSDNYIYLVTGNGTFNAQNGGRNYGDSALKLSTADGLAVADYYTPYNEAVLYAIDADLGAGGPVLLPGFDRLIFTGKDTVLRVLDTRNLGGFHPEIDQIVQRFQPSTRRLLGAPVFWHSPKFGPVIYYWAAGDFLKVFQVVNGRLQEFTASESTVTSRLGISNAPPMSVSANGSQAGTGIVWATSSVEGDANRQTVPGILRAFDATDVTRELWNSHQNPDLDAVGNFAKFCPPTIANGKVYVATFSGQLQVYGQLPGACSYSLSQTNQVLTSGNDSGNVELNVAGECNWLAYASDTWINISSGVEGSGSGVVSYTVDANPGGIMRTGTISVAGLSFTVIQAGDASIVSAASFDNSQLAVESIAVAFGLGFAEGTESATSDLPTSLAGASVKITDSAGVDRLAPLFFVSPTQINYFIPAATALGNAIVSIGNPAANLATGNVFIERVAPGLFSANANGQGVAAAVVLRFKADNTHIFEPIVQFDPQQNRFIASPIDLGPDLGSDSDRVYLILFGTGIRYRSSLDVVKSRVAEIEVPVSYAGAQDTFVGLDQVNVLLTRNLINRGEVDIILIVDDKAANVVTVNIK